MPAPVIPTRDATRWTLAYRGSVKDLFSFPKVLIPVVALSRGLRWLAYQPVKCLVGACALWLAVVGPWWLGLLPIILAIGLDQLLGSRAAAASGRVARSYRACQLRGQVRRHWADYLGRASILQSGGRVPRHGLIRRTECDLRTTIHYGKAGITAGEVADDLVRLTGIVGGLHSIKLRAVNPDYGWLYFNIVNPLAAVIPAHTMPVAPFPLVTLGRAAEGYWITINLLNTHWKILAQSGGGKSSLLWALILGAEQWDTPPQWWIVDPKMGIELGAMDPAVGGIATRYTEDPSQAPRMFDELWAEGQRRGALMKAAGRRSWWPALGPVVILVVDEFLALGPAATKKSGSLFKTLSQLRAAGIVVIGCAQLPQVETGALGRIGQLFPSSIVGATGGPGMTVAALGDYAMEEAPAHKLSLPADAGKFFMVEEGRSGYVHFKAGLVDDEKGEHVPIARGRFRKVKPEPPVEPTEEEAA